MAELATRDGLAQFSDRELAVLRAAMDVAIPADEFAAGWEGGVARLLSDHGSDFMAWSIEPLRAAVAILEAAAAAPGFAELPHDESEAVFASCLAADALVAGGTGSLDALLTVAYEGYYGGTSEPAGWASVGYRAVPEGVTPIDPDPPLGIPITALRGSYDVIIVGAGAGGGAAASELSRAGKSVLLVERSRAFRNSELRGNHLQGKRAELYDVLAGPGTGNPRVLEHEDGSTELLSALGSGPQYGLVAMALGGGTRLWQGMSWRFFEEDFAMASVYGVPEGSTLADWPFGYDELEPYYDRAEWELGVSGDAASAVSRRTRRTRDYPMPPLPDDRARLAFTVAAHRLGWETSPIPFAINSVPHDGRAACVRCQQCIGNACPVDAKNGSQNSFIPRALATGNCDLIMNAQATAIEHDGRGTATGVRIVVETVDGPRETTVRAATVVVSAGALETPRLVLVSGLGNDWVGRNHHSHGVAIAQAAAGPSPKSFVGPGHSVATVDWVHRNGEAWGGGVLFDLPPAFPVMKAQTGRTVAAAPYGRSHKTWMRETPPALGAMSMVQEIPSELARISADPRVKDRYGMPVARLRPAAHPASQVASDYMTDAAERWVRELGGEQITRLSLPGGSRGSEHSAGTARMGLDPATSATNERGLLWGTSNVYVADASLHPTNGGFNPALTAMACSLRVADLMVRG